MPISCDGVIRWLTLFAEAIAANKEYLTELDSAIGDADHGVNMDRGFQAVLAKLPGAAGQDISSIFKLVGMTLVSTVGGASGPLYGTFFLQMSAATSGKLVLSLEEWVDALDAGITGVARRGKANLGDKTMLDTLYPALNALKLALKNNASLTNALNQSKLAAYQGMLATIPLVALKGRASYLVERSCGHQDPGATSAFILIRSAEKAWSDSGEE